MECGSFGFQQSLVLFLLSMTARFNLKNKNPSTTTPTPNLLTQSIFIEHMVIFYNIEQFGTLLKLHR